MEEYNPKEIEKKWQEVWEREGVFKVKEGEGEKAYVLEMFPYPSGRIHMGHVRNYTIGDAIARYLRMKGKEVLHPMGWDSFGLPAENAAIKHNIHPALWTEENVKYMKGQLKALGFSYDWEREISTCEPEYYRWNQWIFLKMLERGIAYRKTALVNWCPHDETVLANEQIIEGKCWRCGTQVVQREMPSWFLRITLYAEELLKDLEKLRGKWPERVIQQQINWIGKSVGAKVKFLLNSLEPLEVFTTRVDTLFGVTFLVLAPEHPRVLELARVGGKEEEVKKFLERVRRGSTRERATAKEKEGVFLGVFAKHPVTGEKIPTFVASYVLYEYGTGVVMGVPAHDQRDFEFAKKYKLPIKPVVFPEEDWNFEGGAYEGEGTLKNSGRFDGLNSKVAREEITKFLKEKGLGDFHTTYKLRDWNISRQRYWGTPIPVVYCKKCGTVGVREEDLPVLLPKEVKFSGKGNPLKSSEKFLRTKCPKCGGEAVRETDTMDTFFDSSWYYLRFIDPKNKKLPFDPKKVKRWMPVDFYIGGIEHAVLHLLYARFFYKFLRDLGLVEGDEPFERLITQGMVLKKWVSVSKLLNHLGISPKDEVSKLREAIVKRFG